MKVSTKGRYGLRALVDLAAHENGQAQPLVNVAKRQNLSVNYLEQVFAALRKAEIVKSIKGPSGGYMLSKDAKELCVGEILTVLEGKFSITEQDSNMDMDNVQKVIYEMVWDKINDQVNEFLERTTLAQLVKEYQKLDKDQEMMFYI